MNRPLPDTLLTYVSCPVTRHREAILLFTAEVMARSEYIGDSAGVEEATEGFIKDLGELLKPEEDRDCTFEAFLPDPWEITVNYPRCFDADCRFVEWAHARFQELCQALTAEGPVDKDFDYWRGCVVELFETHPLMHYPAILRDVGEAA